MKKFEGLNKYKDKVNGITVLYPGGFKPLTGAHIHIIDQYLQHPNVKKVVLFISPAKRDEINADDAYDIVKKVLTDRPIEIVLDKKSYSPILSVYRWIEKPEREPGKYALASSTKGSDYKRVKEFTNNYQPDKFEKNLPKGVKIIELLIDVDPLTYENGEPISATQTREDLRSGTYEKFKTNYPGLNEKIVKFIWDFLNKKTEDIEEAGNTEFVVSGGLSGYERVYPSQKYKSIKNIVEMGGAAGHIRNIWEASELTFGDLKEIINKSLHGELKNITEKLDGQNILITFRDGKVLASRSTKHLKNFGEDAMDIDEVKRYFREKGTPSIVEKAYVDAMEDFQNVFDHSSLDIKKIFKDGKNWLNIEILYTDNENVIPYNRNQLRIHHMRTLDKDGKIIEIIEKGKLDKLIINIEELQNEAKVDNTFLIRKTNPIIIKHITDSNNIAIEIIREIKALRNSANLNNENTIEDYVEAIVKKEYIQEQLPELEEENMPNEEFINTLAKRWGKGDKSTPINKLLKDQPAEIQEWVKKEEKRIKDTIEIIIEPFIEIFSKLGVTVLKNLEGLATKDKTEATKKIKDKLHRAINHLKNFMNKKDIKDIKNFNKKVKEMSKHLERLEKMGGIHTVVPIEGIVFEYNGKLLKLTGSFTPLLRIIGFLRFGS